MRIFVEIVNGLFSFVIFLYSYIFLGWLDDFVIVYYYFFVDFNGKLCKCFILDCLMIIFLVSLYFFF